MRRTDCFAAALLAGLSFGASRFSYVVRSDQWDTGVALDMLEDIAKQGLTVQRSLSSFTANGDAYPTGSFVISGAMPKDDSIQLMGMRMGVKAERINGPFDATLEPVKDFTAEGSVQGQGRVTLLSHRENSAFNAMAFLLERYEGVSWTADGTIILDGWYTEGPPRARNFSRQFGLALTLTDVPPKPAWQLKRPRVAVRADDEIMKKIFEQFNVPYTAVRDNEMAAANFRSRFDSVITLGDAPKQLWQFVHDGGTWISLGTGMMILGGNIIGHITVDAKNPIAFGMPPETDVTNGGSATGIEPGGEIHSVAKFWDGRDALLEARYGSGRAIRFAFFPLTPGTYKFLLNAVYLASAKSL